MGPIERELRKAKGSPDELLQWALGGEVHIKTSPDASFDALDALLDAGGHLGLERLCAVSDAWRQKCLPDLFPEAIEAAEALGL